MKFAVVAIVVYFLGIMLIIDYHERPKRPDYIRTPLGVETYCTERNFVDQGKLREPTCYRRFQRFL